MRIVATLLFLACSLFGAQARATTFVIDRTGQPGPDPAATFAADCSGAQPAEDCDLRAAALQAELIDLLSVLSGSDAQTVALFEAVADMPDPALQEMALQYFKTQTPPPSFWAKVRSFFFGPDSSVGYPAAELFAFSNETSEQDLADAYFDGRPSNLYGDNTSGSGLTDSWAISVARDAAYDAVASFGEAEIFSPADRLLVYDRTITELTDPTVPVAVTAFATDASDAAIEAHFKMVFGTDPQPPISAAVTRQQEILVEVMALTPGLMSGDPVAGARYRELADELQKVQDAINAGSAMNCPNIGCGDHKFWVAPKPEGDDSNELRRAVAYGSDALVPRTVIRYFNGNSLGSGSPGTGNPMGGGNMNGETMDDGGCGCTAASGRAPAGLASGMLLFGLALYRARRRR